MSDTAPHLQLDVGDTTPPKVVSDTAPPVVDDAIPPHIVSDAAPQVVDDAIPPRDASDTAPHVEEVPVPDKLTEDSPREVRFGTKTVYIGRIEEDDSEFFEELAEDDLEESDEELTIFLHVVSQYQSSEDRQSEEDEFEETAMVANLRQEYKRSSEEDEKCLIERCATG